VSSMCERHSMFSGETDLPRSSSCPS